MAILLSCTENLLVLFKPMKLAKETSIDIQLGSMLYPWASKMK